MGVTSSGLLDEERDASADSMSAREVDSPDNTFIESGERDPYASGIFGKGVAGTFQVNFHGPCIYYLP